MFIFHIRKDVRLSMKSRINMNGKRNRKQNIIAINFSITTPKPNACRLTGQIVWWAKVYIYMEVFDALHKRRISFAHSHNGTIRMDMFVVAVVDDVEFLRVYILFLCDSIPHTNAAHTLTHTLDTWKGIYGSQYMRRSFLLHCEWRHARKRQQKNIQESVYETVRPLK